MLPRNDAGFTLLEIIVALAIAAVGIAAVAKYTGTAADVSYETEQRMLAVWVAGNRLSESRITRAWPTLGNHDQAVNMGGRTWYLTETVRETGTPDIRRVEIQVYTDPQRRAREFAVHGYLARYLPPERGRLKNPGDEPLSETSEEAAGTPQGDGDGPGDGQQGIDGAAQ